MRTSSSPAFLRTTSHGAFRLLRRAPRSTPGNDPRIVGLPGQSGQDLSRRRRQRDRACARLGVAQAKLVVFEIDVLPTERQDFIASASGQHQQPEPCRRGGRDLALRLEFVEHGAQPHEFPLRQEALAARVGYFLMNRQGLPPS